MLFKLLQNLEKEMKILNSFCEITTTSVPKSNKDKTYNHSLTDLAYDYWQK